eukprot:m.339439 g.339439  ORF g.339439 m.339439 type:complete len:354 (+) comp20583_c1_seq7:241-1302(+)
MAYQNVNQGYAAPGAPYIAPQYGVPHPAAPYGGPPQQYGLPPATGGYGSYGVPQPVQQQPAAVGFGGYGAPPAPQQQQPPFSTHGGVGAPPPQAYQGRTQPAQAPAPAAPKPAKFKPGDEIMGHPTCKPVRNFDEEADATAVRTAIKEGSNGAAGLINIIAYRSTEQRQKIRGFYKTMTGRDMMEDIRGMLHMNTHRVVAAMMRAEDERDAHYLYKAMKGRGYDEDALIEVIVSRSSEQLKAVKAAYKRAYEVDLEDEVLREARGSFKKLLIGLLQANRTPWETEVDMAKCRKDAKDLCAPPMHSVVILVLGEHVQRSASCVLRCTRTCFFTRFPCVIPNLLRCTSVHIAMCL